jgi:hypothetical protein
MARNRVIYQNKALLIAPNSTGVQVSGSGISAATVRAELTAFNSGELASGVSLLRKLDRIQSCNFNLAVNRQDINELGKLARLDSIVNDSPTVGLDFSYYVTDGLNERLLGFNMTGVNSDAATLNGAPAISGLMVDTQGNNYYILTVDEGEDAVGSNLGSATDTVVCIGNGFISEYGFNASVGDIPTASVSVEAFNIKADKGSSAPLSEGGGSLEVSHCSHNDGDIVLTGRSPAINYNATPATKITASNRGYMIPPNYGTTGILTTGNSVSALRPGDIVLSLPENKGLAIISGDGKAHIQSFSFSVPLSRTVLGRLGNTFGFARVVNVPLNMDVSINANVSELRSQNLFDLLCAPEKSDFFVTLNDCDGAPKMRFDIKGAIFQSESFSNSIGDGETVDLTYSVQIGGINDVQNNLFMSGSYIGNASRTADTPPSEADLKEILTGFYQLGTNKNY